MIDFTRNADALRAWPKTLTNEKIDLLFGSVANIGVAVTQSPAPIETIALTKEEAEWLIAFKYKAGIEFFYEALTDHDARGRSSQINALIAMAGRRMESKGE